MPLKGPQTAAFESPADFLFYGGAAGGGKTDLAIGLALTRHRRSVIFRREYKQLHAITDRTAEVLGTRKGFNSQANIWNVADGRRLEFGACQHAGDEIAFQGRPHDLKAFDEVGHFLEAQFRFLCGWLRTTHPLQRCRVLCTGNPPTDAEGEWVVRFWGPWLDEGHSDRALPGELRWFAMIDGEDLEVADGRPFERNGEVIEPRSRTFIPSSVEDNPFLSETGYRSVLQALPEPLRSQMLKGDFSAGLEDDPWQVIPTAWVRAAQDRWTAQDHVDAGPMDSMGVDVARGGRDSTVVTMRHGRWFAEQVIVPGHATPDGATGAALVVQHRRDKSPVHVDVVGVGGSVLDHLVGNGVQAEGVAGSERGSGTDQSGKLRFANRRSELWWRMREALDPTTGEELSLPPDRALRADLVAPRFTVGLSGIQAERKEDLVKRIGRSPDKGDSAVLALISTPKEDQRDERRPSSARSRSWMGS